MNTEFFDLAFWQNFVSNGLATLLGVIVGIPIGLWLDRRRSARETKGRQRSLLSTIAGTLLMNLAVLDSLAPNLTPDDVPLLNVDPTVLDATAGLKWEIIDDAELNAALDLVRYALQDLRRKLDLQLEMENSSFKTVNTYMASRKVMMGAIKITLERTRPEIAKAIEGVKKHLEALGVPGENIDGVRSQEGKGA